MPFSPPAVDPSSWVRNASGIGKPEGAVVAGHDVNGNPLYIGRACHDNDLIPCQVMQDLAYVPYAGRVFVKSNFEWLCNGKITWQPSNSGRVPSDALPGGMTEHGESLYIGRTEYKGNLVVGKVTMGFRWGRGSFPNSLGSFCPQIHPSHKVLYIGWDALEVKISNYEVLIERLW